MKALFLVFVAALFSSGCASRVILSEDTPGAKVINGTAVAFVKKEKKVGLASDLTENTANAFVSTTAGNVVALGLMLYNRLNSGPYMELQFRPHDGSPDLFLPFWMNTRFLASPGDQVRIIQRGDDITAMNLTIIERHEQQLRAAQKK